jgi:hypothetical protein
MNIPATWLIPSEGLVGRSLRLICRSLVVTLFLGLVCLASSPGHGREIESYAIVRDDGSLRIQGRNLRLFGIFIPDTGRVCGKTLPACGSRAAIALDALLEGRGFVRCRLMGAGTAICYVPFIGQPGGETWRRIFSSKASPSPPPKRHGSIVLSSAGRGFAASGFGRDSDPVSPRRRDSSPATSADNA